MVRSLIWTERPEIRWDWRRGGNGAKMLTSMLKTTTVLVRKEVQEAWMAFCDQFFFFGRDWSWGRSDKQKQKLGGWRWGFWLVCWIMELLGSVLAFILPGVGVWVSGSR